MVSSLVRKNSVHFPLPLKQRFRHPVLPDETPHEPRKLIDRHMRITHRHFHAFVAEHANKEHANKCK
jgi:hypothetical protein